MMLYTTIICWESWCFTHPLFLMSICEANLQVTTFCDSDCCPPSQSSERRRKYFQFKPVTMDSICQAKKQCTLSRYIYTIKICYYYVCQNINPSWLIYCHIHFLVTSSSQTYRKFFYGKTVCCLCNVYTNGKQKHLNIW